MPSTENDFTRTSKRETVFRILGLEHYSDIWEAMAAVVAAAEGAIMEMAENLYSMKGGMKNGSVDINDDVTSATVTFEGEFSEPPKVIVSPSTSFGNVTCWAEDVTETGFTAHIGTAPGAGNTCPVSWIAAGKPAES